MNLVFSSGFSECPKWPMPLAPEVVSGGKLFVEFQQMKDKISSETLTEIVKNLLSSCSFTSEECESFIFCLFNEKFNIEKILKRFDEKLSHEICCKFTAAHLFILSLPEDLQKIKDFEELEKIENIVDFFLKLPNLSEYVGKECYLNLSNMPSGEVYDIIQFLSPHIVSIGDEVVDIFKAMTMIHKDHRKEAAKEIVRLFSNMRLKDSRATLLTKFKDFPVYERGSLFQQLGCLVNTKFNFFDPLSTLDELARKLLTDTGLELTIQCKKTLNDLRKIKKFISENKLEAEKEILVFKQKIADLDFTSRQELIHQIAERLPSLEEKEKLFEGLTLMVGSKGA